MTTYIENPPWVDRVLTDNWEAIVRRFGPAAPITKTKRSGKRTAEELGCGHYGCVIATESPGIVFKVTSDATEAAFVVAATQIGEWPDGIVRYTSVYQTPDKHKGRNVYLLAREEASSVGGLARLHGPMKNLEYRAFSRLQRFQTWAAIARNKIRGSSNPGASIAKAVDLSGWARDNVEWDNALGQNQWINKPMIPSRFSGPSAIAFSVRASQIVAEEMANEDVGYLIGGALGFYIEHGLLLADVHSGNVGKVNREEYSRPPWVITDPGHMVPIDPKWTSIEVPQL